MIEDALVWLTECGAGLDVTQAAVSRPEAK